MDTIPAVVPPITKKVNWNRRLSATAPLAWLKAGWYDFKQKPMISLIYGLIIFAISLIFIAALFTSQKDYFLFPAIAGFMVMGPAFAVGLYKKSKYISEGREITFSNTRPNWRQSGGQILFIGVILLLLLMLWVRAAVLLYALFFGFIPFEGLANLLPSLFSSSAGILLMIMGTMVGGLFAAFAFAISMYSIPMLLDKNTDAFTAMGTSIALSWHNFKITFIWGFIVSVLFLICCLTAFTGLIIIFPILGHATWHSYLAMKNPS